MTRHSLLWFGAVAVATCAATAPTAAQETTSGSGTLASSQPPAGGWTVTPTMLYSATWDGNALLRGRGDEPIPDFVNILQPRAQLNFTGGRGQLSGSYDGAFLLYRDLDTLDSYDQRGSLVARRLISPHVALFGQNSIAAAPTTELAQLVGVPFTRTGSRLDNVHGGIELALTKYTSMTASYHFDWVRFDVSPDVSTLLLGGHSHGGSLILRRRMSERVTLSADYDLTHALVAGGSQVFDVQNSAAGFEYKLSDLVRIVGAVGVARLAINDLGPARTGPVYRAGLTRQFRKAAFDMSYSRSFVPSYGFGGTTQNQWLTTQLNLPLSRRWFSHSSFAWGSNDPLTPGALSLRTWWSEASIGYDVQPWARIEAFYAGTRQNIDRPGGLINRNRFGFQIVTAKPLRIR
jgi:hypothetical protein